MRAVFLDRDGVLNRDSEAHIRSTNELTLLPGAAEAAAQLSRRGFAVIVVTNQSGIARGYLTLETLEAIHNALREAVRAEGGALTDIYVCPHGPNDGCVCRKPSPYLVHKAAADHDIDLAASFFVGDKPTDITCGRAAGCRTILVLSGNTTCYDPRTFAPPPDRVCADLAAAAAHILALPDA